MNTVIEGRIVDVVNREIIEGKLHIEESKIKKISREPVNSDQYILPGLIDAHIHIESSMLVPSEFARIAVLHGTTSTVSDPHEIANVLGMEGIEFMLENARQTPFKFNFGAPSCVPATPLETSGAVLGEAEIDKLLATDDILYLAEMMNFPGVVNKDKEVMKKLEHAKKYNKPVDGHAPALSGHDLVKYANAGITTDHECFTLDEAEEKIKLGMKILIREGSAAKNFNELIPLIEKFPQEIMFCSDDKHPDDLIDGHINLLVKRALKAGYNLFDVLAACTINPVNHYKLNAGLLQEEEDADFIIVNNLTDFEIVETWIRGQQVVKNARVVLPKPQVRKPNVFELDEIKPQDLNLKASSDEVHIIEIIDGQLVTNNITATLPIKDGCVQSDISKDIIKIVVINRYEKAKPAIGFIKNLGLKKGAIASTVAHDSHNLIVAGTSDEYILQAINLLSESKGGLCAIDDKSYKLLPLPVAGIMTDEDPDMVARAYKELDNMAKSLGSNLTAPFMSLSFMALLVIPSLKLGDKGLFDVEQFKFIDISKK
jgi:adenine deaminase